MDYINFRAAGLAQIGGYNQGNGSTSIWQGQIGGDFNLFGGILSLDGVGSYAKDGVITSIFNGMCAVLTKGPFAGQTGCVNSIPNFYNADDLKATLSNNTGVLPLAKYTWGALNLFGGYEYFATPTRVMTIRTASRRSAAITCPKTLSGTRIFRRRRSRWRAYAAVFAT